MKSLNPFPYIYKSKFDFQFDNYKSKVDGHLAAARQTIEDNNYHTHERGGGVTSVVINRITAPHEWDEFADFRPWLYDKIDEVWDLWKLSTWMRKYVSDSWINVHPPGAWTEEHHHQNVQVAVAAYLNVPKDSGRLLVQNPLCYYKKAEPLNYHYYQKEMDWAPVEVKTGDVLFFPGWLTHKTEVNKGDQDRYIMSLNIMGTYVD